MNATTARRILAGLAALAGLEVVLGGLAYRDAIGPQDWPPLADAVAAEEVDTVRLATPWLGPRARMEVPALAAPNVAAPADLHGVTDLLVVGLGDDDWSDALDRELEGAARPHRRTQRRVGPFTLSRYAFPSEPTTLQRWVDTPPAMDTPSGSCRVRGASGRCKEGVVSVRFAEVDYEPRRCLTYAFEDGTPLTLSREAMPLGTVLRGHVGVSDFNGRLRSDAAIRVEVRIDGDFAGRFVTTDAQGWQPFTVPTTPGPHDVEVVLTDTVKGTWGKRGYSGRGGRKVCFELRSIDEGDKGEVPS
ncbi:MAG: hypothetical protein AAGA54_29140 [Myxococcota bacterium]